MATAKKVVKKPVKKVVKKVKAKTDKVGAPAFYSNLKSLQDKVKEYFTWIQGEFKEVKIPNEEGGYFNDKICLREPEPPTITGLALFLGFESRQSVYDYEKNGLFSYTIKEARLRVENGYEKALLSRNSTGAIFALKNFGWSDKQEVTNTNVNMNVEVTKEEAKEISKALDDKY